MPLKYYVTKIQAEEWQEQIAAIPDDWQPNEKQAEAIRLATAQIAHFHENGGRILTDEEVECIGQELMRRLPARAYELYRYEGRPQAVRERHDSVDPRINRMKKGYSA